MVEVATRAARPIHRVGLVAVMNLSHTHAFCLVAQHRSFRVAAEKTPVAACDACLAGILAG
jgi:hypothetical protein